MAGVDFARLLEIYRHTRFDADGREGVLSIANDAILATLNTLESDDEAAADGGIGVLVEPATLAVGLDVRVRISAPRLALGILALDFDQLLNAPGARLAEPAAYFVVEGGLSAGMAQPPARLLAYRAAVETVALLAEAASYLDPLRQELIFIHDGKFTVPVRYDAAMLDRLPLDAVKRLRDQFGDETHKDQKLEILAEAVVRTCQVQPPDRRFAYLLDNLGVLADAVRDGYRLFASNFSYAKIRSELEAAKLDYVTKIHKTVVDIQGQLLGIPVATVIVASQLKVATACSIELWADVAIVGGAWIFLALLLVAIANQWFTLGAIKAEIDRQKGKLIRDYAAISTQFTDIFASLGRRIAWHRWGLGIVAAIAIGGAVFASIAFVHVVRVNAMDCLTGKTPLVPPK
jgi:hypothetical protein